MVPKQVVLGLIYKCNNVLYTELIVSLYFKKWFLTGKCVIVICSSRGVTHFDGFRRV